jgi:hypothetical protein
MQVGRVIISSGLRVRPGMPSRGCRYHYFSQDVLLVRDENRNERESMKALLEDPSITVGEQILRLGDKGSHPQSMTATRMQQESRPRIDTLTNDDCYTCRTITLQSQDAFEVERIIYSTRPSPGHQRK